MNEENLIFFEKVKDVEDQTCNVVIGKCLLDLRECFGISQSNVAKAMQVSRHFVHNIEYGLNQKKISFSTFKKYLEVFEGKVSVADFFRWCKFN